MTGSSRLTVSLVAVACTLLGGSSACAHRDGNRPAPSGSTPVATAPTDAGRAEVLAADVAHADSATRRGVQEGLISAFAEDLIYLHPGAPVVRGREAVRALLSADTTAARRPLQWQPIRAELSKDGSMGYTYGFTALGAAPGAGPDGSSVEKAVGLHFGRYISVWSKRPEGKWEVAAHVQIGAPVSEGVRWPDLGDLGWEQVTGEDARGSARPGGPRDELLRADRDFARVSSERGAAEAFARYADPEATMFSATGEIVRGPREIRGLFADMPPDAALLWQPIQARAALSGDLGYTVGVAEFRNVAGQDGPPVIYTKYLTVWKRQLDGSWKFVVDGGNRRPPGDELESTRP